MPHVANRWFCDTPHTSGWRFYDALELQGNTFLAGALTANLALTRVAAAEYALERTAAAAETYIIAAPFANTRRLLESENPNDAYRAFRGGASQGYPYNGGPPYFPPYTGATQLVPPTNVPAKGIEVTDIVVVYSLGVASLTSIAASLNETVFANNALPVVTNLPLTTTTYPLTVPSTGPYVVVQPVTTPVFVVDDLSDLTLEVTIVLANTGTLALYGIGFHCNFNWD